VLQGTAIFVVMLGLMVGCGDSPTSPNGDARSDVVSAAATVAQVAAAITGQDAPLADEAKSGKNLGFDTHTYPGDKTMRAWKQAPGAPYSWVGYYLPSPCHKDPSWVGKRKLLTDMGWGLAVVYVGQQTWGRQPRSLNSARIAQLIKSGTTCNADLLASERGAADAADAIAATEREGFPARSIVFLDIERMEKMPQAMRDYYRAWAKALLADGRYRPGVYVHKFNAQAVYDDLKAEFAAAGVNEEPRIWVASGRNFDEGKAPQDVGFAFAGVWQGMIDVAKAVADIKLPVDVNVSTWTSPSEPAN
ncbi:MAG: glycoside hydrolase domain-containing protein, partial [Gemmatimonadaceae bacterium]